MMDFNLVVATFRNTASYPAFIRNLPHHNPDPAAAALLALQTRCLSDTLPGFFCVFFFFGYCFVLGYCVILCPLFSFNRKTERLKLALENGEREQTKQSISEDGLLADLPLLMAAH